jgi:hypothetical protein
MPKRKECSGCQERRPASEFASPGALFCNTCERKNRADHACNVVEVHLAACLFDFPTEHRGMMVEKLRELADRVDRSLPIGTDIAKPSSAA